MGRGGWGREEWMGRRKEGRKKKHVVIFIIRFFTLLMPLGHFDQANFVCLKTQNHVLWVQNSPTKSFQVSVL